MSLKKIVLYVSLFLFLCSFMIVGILFAWNRYEYHKYAPIRILNSVVEVENSSGIIVYANKDITLVLTAFHVVQFGTDPITISVLYLGEDGIYTFDTFPVLDIEIDTENDLALLSISPIKGIKFVKIVKEDEEPITGEDIYLGANPNLKFRSIKKGIISSKFRFINSRATVTWEVSGEVIYGSSGGGAFTKDGKLFGTIISVDVLKTDFCLDKNKKQKCLSIPITDTGFIAPPETVRSFILNSSFGFHFDYLRE